MMSHKDQLIALFISFGLQQGTDDLHGDFHVEEKDGGQSWVCLHEGQGHLNFFARMVFDSEGKFIEHGIWE